MLATSSFICRGVQLGVQGALCAVAQLPVASSSESWTQLRYATKKAGGSAKQSVGSHPKHLGAKMSDGELAFPGMILVRQRGTKFHPGPNVGLGRDHTLFATDAGLVRVTQTMGPGGKERRIVSIEPVAGVVGGTSPSSQQLGAQGLTAAGATAPRQITEDLVLRRGQIKRAMLRGSVPLEPALYFGLPRRPDSSLTWMMSQAPAADATKP